MRPQSATVCALLLLQSLALALPTVDFHPGLVNTELKRELDVSTHVEEEALDIEVKNEGKKEATFYILAVSAEKSKRLSFVDAEDDKENDLAVEEIAVKGLTAPAGTRFYQIALPTKLAVGESALMHLLLVSTHTIVPYPEQITQSEVQLVRYVGTLHAFSAYKSVEETTTVKLSSANIISHTESDALEKKKTKLIYGPFKDVKAFEKEELSLHYENNTPFATMKKMRKEIEISHWGNVAVEEHYQIVHTGAKLKGSFSRFDYQRGHGMTGKSSFRTIVAQLPLSATGVYYRDQIGNISTSHLREEEEAIAFEVDPRFPMFGGWKTDFYIGYNLPSNEVLATDAEQSSRFVLNISFSTPFEETVVDEAEVYVIMPEGAKDIKFASPFPVDGHHFGSRVTYLDTTGRPVLILSKNNLVVHHNQPFQVVYTFSSCNMLQEPLLLFVGFFLFFVASWVYMRFQIG